MPQDPAASYCIARLDGHTYDQAAAMAGYSGPPSPVARELWERVEMLRDEPAARVPSGKLQAQADALELQLHRLKAELKTARSWFKASATIEVWEKNT